MNRFDTDGGVESIIGDEKRRISGFVERNISTNLKFVSVRLNAVVRKSV